MSVLSDLLGLLTRVTVLEQEMNMVDASVAAVQADVVTLKTNVAAVQAEVTALLAKQAVAIDAEDMAAIEQIHSDLTAQNAALAAVVPAPVVAPHVVAPVA